MIPVLCLAAGVWSLGGPGQGLESCRLHIRDIGVGAKNNVLNFLQKKAVDIKKI